jgi:hypothetical protein
MTELRSYLECLSPRPSSRQTPPSVPGLSDFLIVCLDMVFGGYFIELLAWHKTAG